MNYYLLAKLSIVTIIMHGVIGVSMSDMSDSSGADEQRRMEQNPYKPDYSIPGEIEGYKLVWNDEFNVDGKPDPENWGYEEGFVRNRELQWYQEANAQCKEGRLVITGRQETIKNPGYVEGHGDWRKAREFAKYTSACVLTKGKQEWDSFAYIEVRARIDTSSGSWPAIWLLGTENPWPSCGEIDIMEFYRVNGGPSLLANVAWGTETRYKAKWDTSIHPLSNFLEDDKDWVKKYHTWGMKWTSESIELFLDGNLLNTTSLSETFNPGGDNPFSKGKQHYLLLNLAMGSNGGPIADKNLPFTYEIDYVRVYKEK